MVKNFKGGSKHKKMKKNNNPRQNKNIEKYPGCEYAYIKKTLGNGRFTVFCYDKKERLAKVCGKMHKKVWVRQGDIILVGLRDFEDDKCDIMQKFDRDAIRIMIQKDLVTQKFINQAESINNIHTYNQNIDDDEDDIFDRSGNKNTDYSYFSSEDENEEDDDGEDGTFQCKKDINTSGTEEDEGSDEDKGSDEDVSSDEDEDEGSDEDESNDTSNFSTQREKHRSSKFKYKKENSEKFKKNMSKYANEEIDIDDI